MPAHNQHAMLSILRHFRNAARSGAAILLVITLFTSTGAATVAGFQASLITNSTGQLEIHWPGETGQTYRIDSSADLAIWTQLPDAFTGTGNELA